MSFLCELCGVVFHDYLLFIRHKKLVHDVEDNYLPLDEEDVQNCEAYTRPSVIKFAECRNVNRSSVQVHAGNAGSSRGADYSGQGVQGTLPIPSVELVAEALEGAVVRHYKINNIHNQDLDAFLKSAKKPLLRTLLNELQRLNVVKFGIVLDADFTNVDDEISKRGFLVKNRSITKSSNVMDTVQECYEELLLHLTEHEGRGSGWSLKKVNYIVLRCHKHAYGDRGSSYIPLPKKISNTKACINVQNSDEECFRYAMLCKYVLNKKNKNIPNAKYEQVSHRYNFNGLTYPVSVKSIQSFEKNNPGTSVNIFCLDNNNNVYPYRVVKKEQVDHTDLLLLTKGNISHYVYIKDFNSLIVKQLTRSNAQITVCKRCFCHTFKAYRRGGFNWLNQHQNLCNNNQPVKINLPSEKRAKLKFNKTAHQYKVPIVIYADFEAMLQPLLPTGNQPHDVRQSTRLKYQKHVPYSYCIFLKSYLPQQLLIAFGLPDTQIIYRGIDAAKHFMDDLYDIVNKVEQLYTSNIPMLPLTDLEDDVYNAATNCYICENTFTDDNMKVHDHDHLTGLYRGPACNSCNINYKVPRFIPVLFHNLSGYDGHFVVPELARDNGPIDVLATSSEKYISITKKIGKMKLRFLDSFKFLPSSLATLTENLAQKDLIETSKLVSANNLDLVLKKSFFPCEYVDSFNKFDETSLPPREAFYSKLKGEDLKIENYEHACNVWDKLKIKNLGEYSDFYCKLDTTLLCDIMEEFRTTCLSAYGLDPLHSYTAPGLSWQAMLKQTKCTLELMTDIDQILMVEMGVRGGLTQSVIRHVEANNKYLSDYDPAKESTFLGYFDANNLYGYAMSCPTPYGEFKWIDPSNFDVSTIPQDGDFGYILDCDFHYPDHLHDHHFDLPMLARSEVPPQGKHKKLLLTLQDKERYIAHYWTVKQAIELGLVVKKIHKVLQFKQSYWLKSYIEFNTKRRAAATSDFQKDFFKLMNNSIFGKTLENKRKHLNIKLVTNLAQFEKLVKKPNFISSYIINENLISVSMEKTVIKMDRPMYVGMSILDVSKILMYDFHYNKMVKLFGRENITIAYMDTDAYIYKIRTEDMYKDLKNCSFSDDFDFSDYPVTHPSYDNGRNKKVLGKFKDECKGRPLKELVALMSKCYALQFDSKEVIKKVKGVQHSYVEKNILFDQYKSCLYNNITYTAKFNTIRSFHHKLFTVTETKKSLSSHDDKRRIMDDGVTTFPHGHYSLRPIDD